MARRGFCPPNLMLPLGPRGLGSWPRGAREKLWENVGCWGSGGCLGLSLLSAFCLSRPVPSSPRPKASPGAELPAPSGPQTHKLDRAALPLSGVSPWA